MLGFHSEHVGRIIRNLIVIDQANAVISIEAAQGDFGVSCRNDDVRTERERGGAGFRDITTRISRIKVLCPCDGSEQLRIDGDVADVGFVHQVNGILVP